VIKQQFLCCGFICIKNDEQIQQNAQTIKNKLLQIDLQPKSPTLSRKIKKYIATKTICLHQ
jgi:hypothetical protein